MLILGFMFAPYLYPITWFFRSHIILKIALKINWFVWSKNRITISLLFDSGKLDTKAVLPISLLIGIVAIQQLFQSYQTSKMQKIIVIGSGGAGKSTLAVRLGDRLGLPVVHLDALYWQPGWTVTPKPEWREKVDRDYLRWIWIYPAIRKPKILTILENVRDKKCVLIFRSSAEVDVFVAWPGNQLHTETHAQPTAKA